MYRPYVIARLAVQLIAARRHTTSGRDLEAVVHEAAQVLETAEQLYPHDPLKEAYDAAVDAHMEVRRVLEYRKQDLVLAAVTGQVSIAELEAALEAARLQSSIQKAS